MALYLKEDEVGALLDMPVVLDAVEQVMAAHGRGETVDYPRQRVRLPATITHLLQGGVPDLNVSGFKVYTSAGGRARFWVHLFDATSGDPLAVLEKGRTHPGRWVELGEVVAGIRPGRSGADQITLFESQGMAIQDLAVAVRVLARARERGLGTPLPY
jgi:ornithine cyclodeaminase